MAMSNRGEFGFIDFIKEHKPEYFEKEAQSIIDEEFDKL